MPLCPQVKQVEEFPKVNDLGTANQIRKPFPIRPHPPRSAPAYALSAYRIRRHAISHHYRLVRSNLQRISRRLEDLGIEFREQLTFPRGP